MSEEDIIAVVPPRLSLSLCPILSVRTPDLVMQIEGEKKKKWSKKRRRRPDSITLLYLCYHFSFLPSLPPFSLLPVPLDFASPARKKSTSLSPFTVSLHLCVCEPLQGLTIIKSTETDTHLVCLVTEHSVSPNTGTVMRTTILLFSQNQFNQARYVSRTLYLWTYSVKSAEDLGEYYFTCPWCVRTPTVHLQVHRTVYMITVNRANNV